MSIPATLPRPRIGRQPAFFRDQGHRARNLARGAVFLFVLAGAPVAARPQSVTMPIHHRLLEDSWFIDECPPCGRPTIPRRLRGSHSIQLLSENPLFSRYALSNIDWVTQDLGGDPVRITGSGELTIGGEVVVVQEVRLQVTLATGSTNILRHFTNSSPAVTRSWPNVAMDLAAEETTFTQVFHLSVRSAPLREFWFTTAHGFTPGNALPVPKPDGPYRPAGDILSPDGRVILPNSVLTEQLGLMPPTPPLAVDAFDQLPGTQSLFSLREAVFSETLGDLPSGTLLTSSGSVFRRLKDLLAPFQPVLKPESDPGLDAVQVLDSGEVLFSTASDVATEREILGHGDVLSSTGQVRHRLKELLAAFQPIAGGTTTQPGLDALHVWPHGEVWFSVVNGFDSATVGPVHPGDLLSSGGWIVYRNLELLERFQPLEDLADFGLTSLFVITDTSPAAPAASLGSPRVGPDVQLNWTGSGRVHQVEYTPDLTLPFLPASPMLPASTWTHPQTGSNGWYRIRSW